MADRVLQRHDTAANWQMHNPVLAEGELGIITDGAKGYKIGDGVTAWNVMLKWVIENRPFTKLGIIVSNGCETDEYRIATIEIAKKWGIPYIKLFP